MVCYSWSFVPLIALLCIVTFGFQTKTTEGNLFFHGLKAEPLVNDCKAVEHMNTATKRAPKDDMESMAIRS